MAPSSFDAAKKFIDGAPHNSRQIIDLVGGGDAVALCALQQLLIVKPNPFDPAEAISATRRCLQKHVFTANMDAQLQLEEVREMLSFGLTAIGNAWFGFDASRPTRKAKTIFKDEMIPILDGLEAAAIAGRLGTSSVDKLDLRVHLTAMMVNTTLEWAIDEWARAPNLVRLTTKLAAELAGGYLPPSVAEPMLPNVRLQVAASMHRLVDNASLRAAFWHDPAGVRGLCELQPQMDTAIGSVLLLEAINELGRDNRCPNLVAAGALKMITGVLSRPDSCPPNHASAHIQALGMLGNLLMADGKEDGAGRASRQAYKEGLLPILLAKLETTRADAGSASAAAEQVQIAGEALVRLLADVNNLRKYASDAQSAALLDRAARLRLPVQGALKKAATIVSMLQDAVAREQGTDGMLHACHYAGCGNHETREIKFALCARCKAVRVSARCAVRQRATAAFRPPQRYQSAMSPQPSSSPRDRRLTPAVCPARHRCAQPPTTHKPATGLRAVLRARVPKGRLGEPQARLQLERRVEQRRAEPHVEQRQDEGAAHLAVDARQHAEALLPRRPARHRQRQDRRLARLHQGRRRRCRAAVRAVR